MSYLVHRHFAPESHCPKLYFLIFLCNKEKAGFAKENIINLRSHLSTPRAMTFNLTLHTSFKDIIDENILVHLLWLFNLDPIL